MHGMWNTLLFGNQPNKMQYPYNLDKHKPQQFCFIRKKKVKKIYSLIFKLMMIEGICNLIYYTVSNSVNNVNQSILVANRQQLAFQRLSFHRFSSVCWQRQNFHILASIGFQALLLYVLTFHALRH